MTREEKPKEETPRAEKPREVGIDESLPKITMVELFAKLFGFIAKEISETFGESGEEALAKAVAAFGRERGRGIAERAKLRGLPNTPGNYLASYDMDRSSEFASVATVKNGELEQVFSRCAIAGQFARDGLERYGRIYCDNIDPALAEGYNPEMECRHPEHFFDNGRCRFVFKLRGKRRDDGRGTQDCSRPPLADLGGVKRLRSPPWRGAHKARPDGSRFRGEKIPYR